MELSKRQKRRNFIQCVVDKLKCELRDFIVKVYKASTGSYYIQVLVNGVLKKVRVANHQARRFDNDYNIRVDINNPSLTLSQTQQIKNELIGALA